MRIRKDPTRHQDHCRSSGHPVTCASQQASGEGAPGRSASAETYACSETQQQGGSPARRARAQKGRPGEGGGESAAKAVGKATPGKAAKTALKKAAPLPAAKKVAVKVAPKKAAVKVPVKAVAKKVAAKGKTVVAPKKAAPVKAAKKPAIKGRTGR